MSIDDKLDIDDMKHNCFYCPGNDESCYTYFEYKESNQCLYKHIADRDIAKHLTGIGVVTLQKMLDEYLTYMKMR